MKLSEGVEWMVHCVILAAQAQVPIRREQFAEQYDLPQAYLGKSLQALVKAGVLTAAPGPKGGYRLARPASAVTVLDIVEAVDGSARPFICQEIRQRGRSAASPAECRKPCTVATVMAAAHDAWRASLRSVTIADLVASLPETVHTRNVARLAPGT